MFYDADGYRLLELENEIIESSLEDWKEFLTKLYKKILYDDFSIQSISFTPPLTKIQVFKLKKSNPSISDVFINKSPGNEIEIPVL